MWKRCKGRTDYEGGKAVVGYADGDPKKANVIVKEGEKAIQDDKERQSLDISTFNFWKKEPLSNEIPVTSAFDVWLRMKDLRQVDQETAWLIGLNVQNVEIYCDCVSVGGINEVRVDTRIVFKRLLAVGASKFVFVHNHPSGDPTPSSEDVAFINLLGEIGKTVGIHLLQAVVIGDNTYRTISPKSI
jgi:DNA repair protein RadC